MKLDKEIKLILSRIVVLHEYMNKISERYPDEMPIEVQRIMNIFEDKLMKQVKLLKEYKDSCA